MTSNGFWDGEKLLFSFVFRSGKESGDAIEFGYLSYVQVPVLPSRYSD